MDDRATSASIPCESRTHATIGGFQWNTAGTELTRLATDLLQKAGVPDKDYRHMHAARDLGSTVSLVFHSPAKLQEARLAIRCLGHTHGEPVLWLDASKTRDELRPARLVHRAANALRAARLVNHIGPVAVRTGLRTGQRKVHPRWSASINAFSALATQQIAWHLRRTMSAWSR